MTLLRKNQQRRLNTKSAVFGTEIDGNFSTHETLMKCVRSKERSSQLTSVSFSVLKVARTERDKKVKLCSLLLKCNTTD